MGVYFSVARSFVRSLGCQRSAMTIKTILLLVMVPSPLSTHVVALYLCKFSNRCCNGWFQCMRMLLLKTNKTQRKRSICSNQTYIFISACSEISYFSSARSVLANYHFALLFFPHFHLQFVGYWQCSILVRPIFLLYASLVTTDDRPVVHFPRRRTD